MGAEHLVTNSEVANYYVQKELSEMDTAAYVQGFLEPCGLYGNYMRVPLAFVKDGTVPADSLVSWFVQSSGAEPPHTLEEWMARWDKIERIIDQMDLQLPEYESDKATIRAIFEQAGLIYRLNPTSIYRADGAATKNLSFHLEFAHPDKTLAKNEIQAIMNQIESIK